MSEFDNEEFDPPPFDTGAPSAPFSSVQLVRGSSIKPLHVSWLWPGYLAKGKLHILAGAPGGGKTTLALQIAAIVTTGGQWPDGSRCPAGNVVVWSGEDDVQDTLIPRLLAAGADVSRVLFVGDVREKNGVRSFDPAKDVPSLERAIADLGGASFVLVDPVVSAVQGDGHKSNDVRRGLQPLVDLGMNMEAALLGISHFSKGTAGREPLERVTGSVAFGALARIVFVAAKEQPDEDSGQPPRRMFLRAKNNNGPDGGGFEYALEQRELEGYPGMFASVAAFGQAIEGDAKSILGDAEADPAGDGGLLYEARDWLLDLLADGPKAAREVRAAAAEAGHSWATVRRAKSALKIGGRKSSLRGGWEWTLPGPDA